MEVENVQPTVTASPSFHMACMTELMEKVVAHILHMLAQGKSTLFLPSISWHIDSGTGNHMTDDTSQLSNISPLHFPTE
ncbi:hypothetical protein HAX54_020540, partial [Datura stramonium]|nr:hypothetical protein [Datura stramonium]